MAQVQDVARFFIHLSEKQNEAGKGDLMTNLRLQKLLYFAQGWHLARFGKPLFDTQIEAWQYGPVVPEVYRTFKVNGRLGIANVAAPDKGAFTPDEFELLLDVAREYAPCSTSMLVDQSHLPDTPWSRTAQSDIIPIETMREYFSQRHLNSFDDILDGYPTEVYN